MGDIGKWSTVDDGRSMFQGLHQIWMDGIFEDSCHGTSSLEIFGCDRLSLVVVPNNDAIKTFFEIKDIFRETENGHDFRSHGDVKAIFTRNSVCFSLKAIDNMTELTVVHIDHPFPGDATRIDAQLIAVMDMVVNQGCKEVVGNPNGMEVSGKVKVDIFHWNHLGVPATGSSTLDPKDRAKRRFAESNDGFFTNS